MATRITIMAGGTGGHVFPALAVAHELKSRGWHVRWLGTPNSFESRVVPAEGFELDTIASFRLRGQGAASLLKAPFRMLRALMQAWSVLGRQRPQVVLGMGGFASGPGGLVSRLRRVPLVIHEQNAIPGLTNRWLARVAARVLEGFPGSFPLSVGAEAIGNPLRRGISSLPTPKAITDDRPLNLLVVGGSLGAQALNERVPLALAAMPIEQRPQVRHQAGRSKVEATANQYREQGVTAEVTEFVDDMAEAYGWADLVICRAGALTVAELMAAGVASILVPFPFAVDDHQTANARFLSEAGAAELIQQDALAPSTLTSRLQVLCGDRSLLQAMAAKAYGLAQRDATRRVADVCAELAA